MLKPPQQLPENSKKRSPWLAIFLAVVAAMFLAALLFFLTLGAFGVLLVVGLAVFAFVGVQYLVWGCWLGPMICRDVAAEEQQAAQRGSSN